MSCSGLKHQRPNPFPECSQGDGNEKRWENSASVSPKQATHLLPPPDRIAAGVSERLELADHYHLLFLDPVFCQDRGQHRVAKGADLSNLTTRSKTCLYQPRCAGEEHDHFLEIA